MCTAFSSFFAPVQPASASRLHRHVAPLRDSSSHTAVTHIDSQGSRQHMCTLPDGSLAPRRSMTGSRSCSALHGGGGSRSRGKMDVEEWDGMG
jgi:hypothetical protein